MILKLFYGVDLDDTVWDTFTPSLEFFNQEYGKGKVNLTVQDVLNLFHVDKYSPKIGFFEDMYNLTRQDVDCIFRDTIPLLTDRIRPFEKARQFLSDLKDQNIPFVYITARDEKVRSVTEQSLSKHNFPSADVYFTFKKAELAQELGLTSFLEDSVSNINRLQAVGISCQMVEAAQNITSTFPTTHRLTWNEELTNLQAGASIA
jgi:uncharacterized HAD superfamily protein